MREADVAGPIVGRTIYTGMGVGGPADGIRMASRFPRGLVLVDRENRKVFIYDFVSVMATRLGQFTVRETEGRDEDIERRYTAALESDYDVLSVGAVVQ
jgi:hypothetical protein